jgi:hypothetical protein
MYCSTWKGSSFPKKNHLKKLENKCRKLILRPGSHSFGIPVARTLNFEICYKFSCEQNSNICSLTLQFWKYIADPSCTAICITNLIIEYMVAVSLFLAVLGYLPEQHGDMYPSSMGIRTGINLITKNIMWSLDYVLASASTARLQFHPQSPTHSFSQLKQFSSTYSLLGFWILLATYIFTWFYKYMHI